MRIRHSKTNGKTMQDIPAQDLPPTEEILNLLRKKYGLKEQRTVLVGYLQEKRKELYNLSMRINELETKIDNILVQKLKENDRLST